MKSKDNEERKHCGNFKISVSFDMYGSSRVMKPEAFVKCLECDLRATFKKWQGFSKMGAHKFDIEKVKWNE